MRGETASVEMGKAMSGTSDGPNQNSKPSTMNYIIYPKTMKITPIIDIIEQH